MHAASVSLMLFCVLSLILVNVVHSREFLEWSDLSSLDSSPDAVRSYFEKEYGTRPDGIALNHETYYDAVTPPITEQYSRYCYKELGESTYTLNNGTKENTVIVGTQTVENKSSREISSTATVTGSWSDSVSHTTTTTIGLGFSQALKVEGVFEMGMSFSFETSVSESKTSTTAQEQSASVTVTVPPRSKVFINMQATMREQSANYKAPIRVYGAFGANFPKRVRDHYFWFASAEDVLPKTSGELEGTVTGVRAFDVHTVVEDAVSLDVAEEIAIT